MNSSSADIVILGAGIAGISCAYYLGKRGVRSVVVDQGAIGSHASGFAYGGLNVFSSIDNNKLTGAFAQESMTLHRDLAKTLEEQTAINIEFRDHPSLYLCFTKDEITAAHDHIEDGPMIDSYTSTWLNQSDIIRLEPRISQKALGAVYVDGSAEVQSHRLVLAMAKAAEEFGASIKHGTVTDIIRNGDKITGIQLNNGNIECDGIVLAMGPWTNLISKRIQYPVDIRPLKGQIIRAIVPGPPLPVSVWSNGNYAATKPDGLLWAGTTEEEAGFDETITNEARDKITKDLLKMMPDIGEIQIIQQTACLRPITQDKLIVLGKMPSSDNAYIATGGGRNGILLGPAMGRTIAELVTSGTSKMDIKDFDPGRFTNQHIN